MSLISAVISDANVLIDYVLANRSILELATKELCQIYVPIPVFREVRQLSEAEAKRLGLTLLEPTLEQLQMALAPLPGVSFQDRLCLNVAKENSWVCMTNDGKLRKQCQIDGVRIVWGFDLMLELNKRGLLSKREASKTAQTIHDGNLRITQRTVDRFISKLN